MASEAPPRLSARRPIALRAMFPEAEFPQPSAKANGEVSVSGSIPLAETEPQSLPAQLTARAYVPRSSCPATTVHSSLGEWYCVMDPSGHARGPVRAQGEGRAMCRWVVGLTRRRLDRSSAAQSSRGVLGFHPRRLMYSRLECTCLEGLSSEPGPAAAGFVIQSLLLGDGGESRLRRLLMLDAVLMCDEKTQGNSNCGLASWIIGC